MLRNVVWDCREVHDFSQHRYCYSTNMNVFMERHTNTYIHTYRHRLHSTLLFQDCIISHSVNSLSQRRPTGRSVVHTSRSYWYRRNHHHGCSKWAPLHPTVKDKWGHCCPGNQPSNPWRYSVHELQYTTEEVKENFTHAQNCYCIWISGFTQTHRRLDMLSFDMSYHCNYRTASFPDPSESGFHYLHKHLYNWLCDKHKWVHWFCDSFLLNRAQNGSQNG